MVPGGEIDCDLDSGPEGRGGIESGAVGIDEGPALLGEAFLITTLLVGSRLIELNK